MKNIMCNQKNCLKEARYLYTWPGQDQAGACEDHKRLLEHICVGMGFPLQFIPIEQPKEEAKP